MGQTVAAAAAQAAATPLAIPNSSISVLQTSSLVTVSVVYRIAPVTPMVGRIVGGSITVVGTSSLPVQ
jgi:hypothetical protein